VFSEGTLRLWHRCRTHLKILRVHDVVTAFRRKLRSTAPFGAPVTQPSHQVLWNYTKWCSIRKKMDSGTRAESIQISWVYFIVLRWKSKLRDTIMIRQRRMWVVPIWKWRNVVPKSHLSLLQDRPSYRPVFSNELPNYTTGSHNRTEIYNKTGNFTFHEVLRSVRVTIVAVEKQYYILRVRVYSLSYPPCKAHVPC
jgi:hypothetical protein